MILNGDGFRMYIGNAKRNTLRFEAGNMRRQVRPGAIEIKFYVELSRLGLEMEDYAEHITKYNHGQKKRTDKRNSYCLFLFLRSRLKNLLLNHFCIYART